MKNKWYQHATPTGRSASRDSTMPDCTNILRFHVTMGNATVVRVPVHSCDGRSMCGGHCWAHRSALADCRTISAVVDSWMSPCLRSNQVTKAGKSKRVLLTLKKLRENHGKIPCFAVLKMNACSSSNLFFGHPSSMIRSKTSRPSQNLQAVRWP